VKVIVASVRVLQRGHTFFVTLSQAPLGQRVVITVAPLKYKWQRHVDIEKYLGSSTVRGSAKIIIPRYVVEYLGLAAGDHVWLRLAPPQEEPVLPPVPYLYERRRARSAVLVARRYLEALASPVEWNGRVYVEAGGYSLFTAPPLSGDYYRIPLPRELGRRYTGMVLIAPLTDALEERLKRGARPPGFPS